MKKENGIYVGDWIINKQYRFEDNSIYVDVKHLNTKEINGIITNWLCSIWINGSEIILNDCIYFVDNFVIEIMFSPKIQKIITKEFIKSNWLYTPIDKN